MMPYFKYSAQEIKALGDKVILDFEDKISKIISIESEKRTFDNTVKAFENALAELNYSVSIPIFLGYVSSDSDVRNASVELQQKISKYTIDIFTREDIFKAIKEYSDKSNISDETDKKLLDKIMFEFKQNGLFGDEKTRKKIKKLLKELVDLEIEFSKNLRETKDFIEVDEEDLKGLDESFVKRIKKNDSGKYIITTDYPDYMPFMDNSESDKARKDLEFKFNNRCYPRNVELMERAMKIRRKIAKLLGYKNFADYVLEDRMAKNSENVVNFLKNLYKEVKKKGKKELKILIRMKNKRNGTNENVIYNWEWRYYANKLKKEKYDVDYERLREYFPLERVIKGMFEVFEKVFEVRFVPAELDRWHES
ncbi:MAG: M3 family metallopeptidase, partial [Elusimicrobiales bacterium]|nr:M3 family metallopeptidase [Elusimicrobiales bacterium]